MEMTGRYYYIDGRINETAVKPPEEPGGIVFYEVIRLKDGIPYFFDDHLERLLRGLKTASVSDRSIGGRVTEAITWLAERERHEEINIRISVTAVEAKCSVLAHFIPSFYPPEAMYLTGADVILVNEERKNPGLKVQNVSLRNRVNNLLSQTGAYEALLVSPEGFITEGSRSNVFFVAGENSLVTAPDSAVLSGITRKYVTEICAAVGIRLTFMPVRPSEIGQFSAAFITGTSPMIMPLRSIGENRLNPQAEPTGRLRNLYAVKAERSLESFRMRYHHGK